MLSIVGTYTNGQITFEREISIKKPVKVIITFFEDVITQTGRGLKLTDFSFSKTRELLKDYKGSFSDTVIEERRSYK